MDIKLYFLAENVVKFLPVAPIDKLTTSNIHYKTEKADHFNDFPRMKLTRHALFLLWKYYGIYPVGKICVLRCTYLCINVLYVKLC